MFQYLSKKIRNRKGFTLVELIVVIAILGILAAVAVPKMGSFRSDAEKNTHAANVRTLQSAATMYLAEHGTPSSEIKWNKDKKDDSDGWGHYLQEWPDNPTHSGAYEVTIETDGDITVEPGAKDTTASKTSPGK